MKMLAIVFLLFFVFMSLGEWLTSQNHSLLIKESTPKQTFIQKTHKKILNKIPTKDKKFFKLQSAIVIGDTSLLNPALKKTYKSLGLIHLFTPSGFHLSALLFLFSFKKLKKYKNKFVYSLIFIFFINGFEALKRILVIKIFEIHRLKLPIFLQKSSSIFLVVFALFFISGDYFRNYLSFSLSFLFLGIIYSFQEKEEFHEWHYFFAFLIAQITIQFYLPQNVGIESFFKGFILGFVFNLCFPFMCLSQIFLYFFQWNFLLYPMKFCHHLVTKANLYFFNTGDFLGFIFWLILFFGFTSVLKKKYKKAVLTILAFSLATSVNFKVKKPSGKLLKEVKASLYSNEKIL